MGGGGKRGNSSPPKGKRENSAPLQGKTEIQANSFETQLHKATTSRVHTHERNETTSWLSTPTSDIYIYFFFCLLVCISCREDRMTLGSYQSYRNSKNTPEDIANHKTSCPHLLGAMESVPISRRRSRDATSRSHTQGTQHVKTNRLGGGKPHV